MYHTVAGVTHATATDEISRYACFMDITHTPSPEDTLQRWQQDAAAVVARMDAAGSKPGVATPAQVRGLSGMEFFEAIFAGKLPRVPIGHNMDFLAVEVTPGRVVFQGKPRSEYINPMGTLHGGWYCTLLDSALGCAVHSTLPAGKAYTTLELKVNLTRAHIPGSATSPPLLRAIGQVIHAGQQVATAEAQLLGPDGKLYAHATTTCMIFDLRG
jgi:uncharacterized protein (TIGR00369 family)